MQCIGQRSSRRKLRAQCKGQRSSRRNCARNAKASAPAAGGGARNAKASAPAVRDGARNAKASAPAAGNGARNAKASAPAAGSGARNAKASAPAAGPAGRAMQRPALQPPGPMPEQEEADSEEMAEQEKVRIPKAVKLRLFRFLHLFSGPRKLGDLEDWLVKLGAENGILVIVDVADLETVPPVDVLDPVAQEEILARGKARFWDAGHGGPACATWSAALFNPGPGFPEPYRSRDQLWGRSSLSGRRLQRVEDANGMLIFTLNVFAVLFRVGAGWTLERPQD